MDMQVDHEVVSDEADKYVAHIMVFDSDLNTIHSITRGGFDNSDEAYDWVDEVVDQIDYTIGLLLSRMKIDGKGV